MCVFCFVETGFDWYAKACSSQSIKPGSGAERYRRGSLARSRASDKQKICTFFFTFF